MITSKRRHERSDNAQYCLLTLGILGILTYKRLSSILHAEDEQQQRHVTSHYIHPTLALIPSSCLFVLERFSRDLAEPPDTPCHTIQIRHLASLAVSGAA
jgi:hypothetical protein